MFGAKGFFALFLTVASLFFTRFLFLDSMFKITVETTAENGKIEISYKDTAGTARSASARVVKNGGASARIWANGITELHLLPPAGTKIINVKIAGVFSVRLLRGVAGMGLGYFTASLCRAFRERKPANRVFCTMAESVLTLYAAAIVFVKGACPENKIFAVLCFAGLILLFGINRGAVSRFFNRPFFGKLFFCFFVQKNAV